MCEGRTWRFGSVSAVKPPRVDLRGRASVFTLFIVTTCGDVAQRGLPLYFLLLSDRWQCEAPSQPELLFGLDRVSP